MAPFAAANASRNFAQLRARILYGARLASPSASRRSTFPLRAALSSACFLLRMTFKALCPENSLGLAYAELDPAGEMETASRKCLGKGAPQQQGRRFGRRKFKAVSAIRYAYALDLRVTAQGDKAEQAAFIFLIFDRMAPLTKEDLGLRSRKRRLGPVRHRAL